MITLAERLKELRKSYNFTQRELAQKLGITDRTYQYYESGKTNPPLETLIALTKIFDVSADLLLGNSAGLLRGLDDPELIDILAKESVGSWHVPIEGEDPEVIGDVNEHNALVYTANIRKFMKNMIISPEFEREFESYVAFLRTKSKQLS